MVNVALSIGQLVVALLLVLLNGFFVASEFAFVRIRGTSVEQLAAEGRTGAATLQEVMTNLDDYLATTQLGITIASLGLGWVGEPAVASLIEPVLEPLSQRVSSTWSRLRSASASSRSSTSSSENSHQRRLPSPKPNGSRCFSLRR